MATLAQNVFDNTDNRETLLRDDVRTLLPTLLDKLKRSPLPIPTLIATAISLVKTSTGEDQLKGLLAAQNITITDAEIALLKDTDVQALLTSNQMTELLRLQGTELDTELTALWNLVEEASTEPVPVLEPDALALALQVYNKYMTLLMRSDIAGALPLGLPGLKSPDVQAVISANPSIINVVVADPDILESFGVFLQTDFNNLLKTDDDVRAMLRDPLVQSLLANPDAIDALIELLPQESSEPAQPYTVDETMRTIPIPEVSDTVPKPVPVPEPTPTTPTQTQAEITGRHPEYQEPLNFAVVDVVDISETTPVWRDLPILSADPSEVVIFPFGEYVSGADTFYVDDIENNSGKLIYEVGSAQAGDRREIRIRAVDSKTFIFKDATLTIEVT